MARPVKQGLDYCILPTNLFGDPQSRWLMSRGGPLCLLLHVGIQSEICGNSYYIHVDKNRLLDYSCHLHVSIEKIQEMIEIMVELNCFDEKLYHEHHVLTSSDIQEYYLFVKNKKKRVAPITITKYKVTDEPDLNTPGERVAETPVMDTQTPITDTQTPELDTISTQREEKEKKEKEKEGNGSFNIITPAEKNEEANSESPLPNRFRTICQEFRRELLNNEDWIAELVRVSGKGATIIPLMPEVMDLFESHVITLVETYKVKQVNHYARWFRYWWASLGFKSAEQIIIDNNRPKHPGNDTSTESRVEQAQAASQRAAELAMQMMDDDEWTDDNEENLLQTIQTLKANNYGQQ